MRKPKELPLNEICGLWRLEGYSETNSFDIVAPIGKNELLKLEPNNRFSHAVTEGPKGQTYHGTYLIDERNATLHMDNVRKGLVGPKQADRKLTVIRLTNEWLVLENTAQPNDRWLHFKLVAQVTGYTDVY